MQQHAYNCTDKDVEQKSSRHALYCYVANNMEACIGMKYLRCILSSFLIEHFLLKFIHTDKQKEMLLYLAI